MSGILGKTNNLQLNIRTDPCPAFFICIQVPPESISCHFCQNWDIFRHWWYVLSYLVVYWNSDLYCEVVSTAKSARARVCVCVSVIKEDDCAAMREMRNDWQLAGAGARAVQTAYSNSLRVSLSLSMCLYVCVCASESSTLNRLFTPPCQHCTSWQPIRLTCYIG